MQLKSIFIILCATGLAACGGGGDSASSNPATAALSSTTPVATNNPPSITQTGTPTVVTLAPSQASNVTAATSCGLSNFQTDLLREVNAARAQARSCGTVVKPAASALAWNNILFAAALGHSQDMAQRNFFAHTNLDGKTAGQRAISAGYNYAVLGENIAAGQRTVSEVMASWLDSPGHCNNIMDGVFSEIAVACVSTSRFEYPTYWSMELAKPR
jgi:uncharacterized protein YkwD